MADNTLPSKEEKAAPGLPSRAQRSRKEEGGPIYRRVRGRLKLKPAADSSEQFEPPASRRPAKAMGNELQVRSTGRKNMKPTKLRTEDVSQESGRTGEQEELPDQIPPRRRRSRGAGDGPGGYVRFRVHVEDGEMSIIDSHLVDGDLMTPPTIHGEYAYEVTDGSRMLHADTIPDLGVVRSFSNPQGPPEQLRHHTYRESSYDFDVRVRADELNPDALPKIDIVLYRVKERAPTRELSAAAPLGTQFEREFREITRVSGIPDEALPEPLRRTPRGRSSS